MNLRSFFGILTPKLPYADVNAPAETLPLPGNLTLLWPDRMPSDLAARAGDEVLTGQDLAQNGKGPFVSTGTGRVQEISGFNGPDGHTWVAVSINPISDDSFEPSLSLVKDLSKAGAVELRGAINRAGFPVLSSNPRKSSVWPPVEALIVSALDRDPLSVANQQVFRDHRDQVAAGVQLLTRATGASRSVLAVPGNLAEFSRGLSADAAQVVLVPGEYPNGLPEMLAKKYGAGPLLKRYGSGFLGNTLVVGVELALAAAACLQTGKPFLEKTVTFSAGGNGGLKNFRVRIGTPVAHILSSAGVELQPKGKLILNGVMGGYTCFSDEQPVTATTDAIHVQAASEVFSFQDTPCINCGRCNAICPVDLEVNLLGRYSEYGIFEKCEGLGAENCIDCGLCAYVCPARRPLVHLISYAKRAIQMKALEDAKEQQLRAEEGL
jgi:electron transport complex protein RnfC